eukprot:SM000154S01370  [mRNA]  locus=s154:82469:83608:+ [translate_table: standard]
MGLLDKLWDDVAGGPQPDKGVGKLRKLLVPGSPRAGDAAPDGPESPAPGTPREIPGDEDAEAKRLMWERRRSGEFQAAQEEARRVTQSIAIAKPPQLRSPAFDRASSLPSSYAGSPVPSPRFSSPSTKENVWRSVFHPGSNKAGMDRMGSHKFDKADPNGPSVYDW